MFPVWFTLNLCLTTLTIISLVFYPGWYTIEWALLACFSWVIFSLSTERPAQPTAEPFLDSLREALKKQ